MLFLLKNSSSKIQDLSFNSLNLYYQQEEISLLQSKPYEFGDVIESLAIVFESNHDELKFSIGEFSARMLSGFSVLFFSV